MTTTLRLADITAAPARYAHIVSAYADKLAAGDNTPPILVSRNSRGLLTVVEGHHRFAAHLLAGRTTIEAFIMSIHL